MLEKNKQFFKNLVSNTATPFWSMWRAPLELDFPQRDDQCVLEG